MAKTLNQFTYSILEAVSNFEITDDSPFSKLWIQDQLVSQNQTLVREAYNNRRLDAFLYQTEEMLEIKQFDKSFQIGNLVIDNPTDFCYVEINPLLSGIRDANIDFVSNISYSSVFSLVSAKRLIRGHSGYYSLGKPTYALINDKIVFRSEEIGSLKYVAVNAIWNDPRDVTGFTLDTAFPTPSEKKLELLTIQHIDYALQHPMDLINDGQRAVNQATPQQDG